MRIDVKGRNLPVSEEVREHVAKRFRKVEKQVSELAELEVELLEERNPAIADSEIAEATLHLKGVTLRARAASPDIAGQAPPGEAPRAPSGTRRGGASGCRSPGPQGGGRAGGRCGPRSRGDSLHRHARTGRLVSRLTGLRRAPGPLLR
jgi:ribosomal subunit interface protein